jgi:BatD DUF11 like domain
VRLGLTAAAFAVVMASSALALAVEVETAVSSQRIGVGEDFVVQLTASGSGGSGPTSARLPVPAGMTASGPSISTRSQMNLTTGQGSTSITLSWTVTANKTGSFQVGPPSATFGSERAQGKVIPIEVVAGGAPGVPRQRTRRGIDPFNFMDPFGNGSPFPPGFNFPNPFDQDSNQPEQPPSYPDEMRLDKAPDPLAFLRVTTAPQHVVVGEQVTLRVYAYGARGQYDLTDTHEPTHADFISFDASPQTFEAYMVPVGDTRYFTVKLRELYLFPLHAGSLRAGNMTAGFTGRGYRQSNGRWPLRDSGAVDVVVSEPPLAGRPPGYKIGDVGEYKIDATVEPREIMAGESIAVVATLSGIGNVPFKIQTPEQHGVEWLEPSLAEHMEWPHGIVQGTRTFSYVVRLTDAGKVDLGELTLPYYDPKRQKYVIARGRLGSINVKPNPNAKAATPDTKPIDRLANVLSARDHLGPFAGMPQPLSDRPYFFGLLLLAPFGVVLAGGALSAATRAREKLRVRGTSLTAQLDSALREAKTLAKSDSGGAVNAAERAVFLAIELKLGLKARAILKSELARELAVRGLPSERAQALARILEDCDAVRFVGAASSVDPAELAERTEATVALLERDKPKSES